MTFWGLLASIAISFSSAFIFAAILFWFDRFEKEPLHLLVGVFLWGAIIAAGGAFLINTVIGLGVFIVTGSEAATNITTASIIAPVIEEIIKGFAVLLVFFIFYKEFDSLLDGVIYAGIAALGFAATENSYYIFTYGFQENGWSGFWSLTFIRLILVGWQHPFFTAFVGIGLAVARLNRQKIIRVIAPLLGLATSIAVHAIHNFLASLFTSPGGMVFTTALDWLGWFLMFIFILILMGIEKKDMVKYLQDEVEQGTLTKSQYETAVSNLKVSASRIKAIFQGNYSETTKLFRNAAELALKKKQLARLGDERGNESAVDEYRKKTRMLSKKMRN